MAKTLQHDEMSIITLQDIAFRNISMYIVYETLDFGAILI